jgi:hypothetical protein
MEQVMIDAYSDFNTGNFSKAELARKYNVSPRTIGRWLEKALESNASDVSDDQEDNSVVSESGEVQEVEYRVIASRKSISISRLVDEVVDGSVVIDKSAEGFDEIFKLIADNGLAQWALETAYRKCQPKVMVEDYTDGKLKVNVKAGNLTYTPDVGVPFEVSGLLSKRIVETIREKGVDGAQTLIAFLNKLMANPSNRAVNELYGFLEHNDIQLTEDGNFLAFKVVRNDYKDKHSGTFDNSVGVDVRVNRNQVDENSEQTCSYGLHVCAKSYIRHFGSGGDRILVVSVDPADVVAIPRDYNNSKMRCAGYKVVEDVTDTMNSNFSY